MPEHRDTVLHICKQLLRIDNRPDGELASLCGLTTPTIKRLRDPKGEASFVRSTTVSAVARALRYDFQTRRIRA